MNTAIRSFENKRPVLGERVYIDPQSAVIGDITIGNDVSVWPMAVIRGDVNYISIGEACSIQDGAILHVTHKGPFTANGQPLILGKGVTVGHQAVLHGCRIDDYCLIGMQTVILDDVHLEHHVMIAAGSLIPPGKRLQSGYLYLGNPAKAIRELTTKELAHLEYSAEHYVRLKDKYLMKTV
jgi:carbonic anhydrase/acetyltransferase-like protein (isoleucine patch superfamily)